MTTEDKDKIEEIKSFIKNSYNPECCSYTEHTSKEYIEDIFYDGENRGYALALYRIGKILDMGLIEPKKQKYNW